MASSGRHNKLLEGKGKRKVKGKTVDLNTFLGEDQDAPSGFAFIRRIDWGDAMENEELDDRYTLDFKKEEKIALPTAPKAAREPVVDLNRVPTNPPYTAFLGNLPYDVMEDDILRFFRKLKVTNVRLPREGGDKGRMRGFGYAEFEDRQSLIEALSLDNEMLRNRTIKVSLAGEHDNDRDRRDDRSDRTAGDWRAASREKCFLRDDRQKNGPYGQYGKDYIDQDSYRGRQSCEREPPFNRERFDRNGRGYSTDRFDRNDRSYSSDRDWDRGPDERDQGFERRYGERGYDMQERGPERGGGGRNRRDFGSGFRDGYDRRRDDGMRDRDRGGFDRRDGFERRNGYDRRDGYYRKEVYERENQVERDAPRERPKLVLQPRTVPLDQKNAPAVTPSSSAIFGGAKPVDTAAREREIEERLAREREENQRDRQEEPRLRRFSTESGPNSRSRRSSESGPPTSFRESFSEDDSLPAGRPPAPRQLPSDSRQYNTLPRIRQRRSSASSTGSDRENSWNSRDNRPPTGRRRDENKQGNINRRRDGSRESSLNRQQQNNSDVRHVSRPGESSRPSRSNGPSSHSLPRHNSPLEQLSCMPTYEEPTPPVYTSANKFSHLLNEEEDVDRGSASE